MTPTAAISIASALACGTITILSIFDNPRSLTRWALGIALSAFGAEAIFGYLANQAAVPSKIDLWQSTGLIALSFSLGPVALFSMRYARGSSLSRFAVSTNILIVSSICLPLIFVSLLPDLVAIVTRLDASNQWIAVLGTAGKSLHYASIVIVILVLVNLERTFRSSVGTMRWRIKYLILGLSIVMFTRLYTSSQAVLFNSVTANLNLINSIGLLVGCILLLRTIIRSGHFDTEIYPSGKLLQNSLTIFIVGAYLVAVGIFAKIASYIGGDAAFAVKTLGILIALTLLGVLLQSDRFKLHLRQFVSRHFKRSLYDHRAIWNEFTEATSSKVGRQSLCQSIAESVSKLFDALSVSVWVFNEFESSLELSSSTSKLSQTNLSLSFGDSIGMRVRNEILSLPGPFNLDRLDSDWAETIKEATENQFPNGGDRTVVPMITGESLLGVIVIGDRVQGIPFTDPDLDILNSLGKHAASTLLNAQLSDKLIETRELEAFQTMAAFFVHDLKNAASTLNIMVQNLPKHWDNPEFRKDALAGISKTGDRIDRLIQQLSAVQSELKVDKSLHNFDTFAEACLNECKSPEQIQLRSEFDADINVSFDAGQLNKVVINLIMNAIEAIERAGRISMRTSADTRYARLTIEDNGNGMSQEFIRKSLFRPFKTTKKSGLGIGMFQSKMIVEAHGGRLEVESEEGKGTKFTMLIPRGDGE